MIRFGIVGAGGIAKKFARDLAFVDDATLTAVSARTEEQAKVYQDYYQCEHAFSSYEAMAKSDVIDAVYIATPHRFHMAHAILFMKHHKHVLIEKPVAVNAEEYKNMLAVQKQEKVLMMEAMWTHFLPATLHVLNEIKTGKLGKLVKTDIRFCIPITLFKSKDHRLLNPHLAGGSLLDLGIYPVSLVSLLQTSDISQIEANASFTRTGVDKSGVVKLIEKNGVIHTLKHNMVYPLGDYAKLLFEHGHIVMHGFHGCQSIRINGKKMVIPYEGEGFVHEIRAFIDDVKHKRLENKVMPYDKSLKVMQWMDQIREKIGLKYPFERS